MTDGRVEDLFELALLLTEGLRAELDGLGLTGARAEVVRVLHRSGSCTQRELASSLRCTPRNVTTLVDGLEHAGHLRRETRSSDRRVRIVRLTDRGEELAARMSAGYDEFAARLFEGVPDDDLAAHGRVTTTLLARVRVGPDRTTATPGPDGR